MNAAHARVAEAFPEGRLSKPPTLAGTGEIRTSGYTVHEKPQDTDRSR